MAVPAPIVSIAALDKPIWAHNPALTVSSDGRILYTQQDNVTNNIMLVENFR